VVRWLRAATQSSYIRKGFHSHKILKFKRKGMTREFSNMSRGFYWVRLFDELQRESYWTVRFHDGGDGGIWMALGSEEEAVVPASPASVVWRIALPTGEGRVVEMWADRLYGFYWMRCSDWRADAPQVEGWSIAEFYGLGWRTIGSDEMWTDNDMQRYPVVGPIALPCENMVGG
jgi:hypothetical protein